MPWSRLRKNLLSANKPRARVTAPRIVWSAGSTLSLPAEESSRIVRIHMEDAGVNAPLVFDLSAMDTALDRMEMLAGTLVESSGKVLAAVRSLLNTLVHGLREDTRISSLVRQNFNLLARKTVERTGHGGEHYIAHSRKEYWRMWGAAIGGGFLTVFTAAIKLHVVSKHFPPFAETILIGTNYAISFLLLQIFGLALATKQPAMTGATLADIIRRNRGDSRHDQITEFGASISRTQLAAALGNILAVSTGAILFNLLWLKIVPYPLFTRRPGAESLFVTAPLGFGNCDRCRSHRRLALACRADRRMVRKLRCVPPYSCIDCAASPRPDHRRRQNAETCRLG